MNKKSTFYIVLTALFTALVFALTSVIKIPSGTGYINFGDAVIFLAAALLGPFSGAIAGGIGSSLADLIGYPIYAIPTLIIKGLEGALCGLLYKYAFLRMKETPKRLLSMVIAGVWMILGYFLADLIILGIDGNGLAAAASAAVINFISGPIQAGVSVVMAFIVLPRVPKLFEGAEKTAVGGGDNSLDKRSEVKVIEIKPKDVEETEQTSDKKSSNADIKDDNQENN